MNMKASAIIRLNSILVAIVFAAMLLLPLAVRAEQAATPKRILVLYWSSKDFPGNVVFDQNFQQALKSSQDWIEYYTEYLDSDRFTGENQTRLMHDYLQQKYANLAIDVVVALGDPPLDFLLEHRNDLFPTAAILALTNNYPTAEQIRAGPGLTGFVNRNTYKETLELALGFHPNVEQVFIVSGTLTQDKRFENACRQELEGYNSRATINYLTDLQPDELAVKVKNLPERSLIFYIWQQAKNKQGKLLETHDNFDLIVRSASVPIYGLASWQVGRGIVGGYLRSTEHRGARFGEVALQIANGARAQDIPIETVPVEFVFDWRELKRWGISESSLPPGSVVRFRVPSVWDEYRWHIITLISVILMQSALITGLVINRTRRKRAEVERQHFASLAEAERRQLDAVISNAPGIVWEGLPTPDGSAMKISFISQYVEKMLGYGVEECLSTPDIIQLVVHEKDREIVARAVAEVLENGKDRQIHLQCVAKDGRQLWAEAHLGTVQDEAGKIVGLRGMTLDITDRKLADESLRRSEDKNRAILRAIPDMMFLLTSDGIYLDYHSPKVDQLLFPPREFIGKSMWDVLPAELAESFSYCFRRARETAEIQYLEYCLMIQGEEHWFEARLVSILNDQILIIVRDITDSKLAEEAIIENEARLAEIVGTAMDAIITIDESRCISLFNSAAERIFGCAAREIRGQRLDRFIPEQFRPALKQHLHALGQTGVTARPSPLLDAIIACRANGEEFPIEASISQLELHGQKFYTVILRDITERREAEIALRESREHLQRAQQAANVGTWEWDVASGSSVWSEGIYSLLGIEPGSLVSSLDSFVKFIHPEDSYRTLAKVEGVLAQGDDYYDEFRVVLPDGTTKWLASKGRVERGSDGQAVRLLGVNIDITMRKQFEERLLRFFELPLIGMAITSPDRLFIGANQKLCDMLGYSMDELIGKSWVEVTHPDDIDENVRLSEQTLKGDTEGYTMDKRFIHRDGHIVYASISARCVRHADQSVDHLVKIIQDITDRHQVLDALRESETRFRDMADTSAVLIWIADQDMQCTYFNRRVLDFTGLSLEELLGEGWLENVHENDRQQCRDAYTAGYADRKPFILEYRLRRADGEFRWIYDIGSPRFASNGEFIGYIGSAVDITDRKRAEEALRNIAEGVSATIGEDFFRTLTQYLARVLEVDYTVVGEIAGDGKDSIRTIANWSDGKIVENITYELANTPCQNVLAGRLLSYTENVQAAFPLDYMLTEMEVESYMGMPLKDSTGRPFGLISVLGRKPMRNVEVAEAMLQIFAVRASAELERKRSEEELQKALAEVSELKDQLEAENIYLQEEIKIEHNFLEIVGHSDAIKYVLFKIEQVAPTDSTVLLLGETGTGKEMAARAIHEASSRRDRPFLKINCAALPANLIESELFGHEKGAFTGAVSRQIGRFELAHGATLFLDEIGEMPLELQSKLLRVLQEGEFERLGSSKTIRADVRIIAATNRNLKIEVQKGLFREDLWYRLNVFPITVPPLRQRKKDIPLLVDHFAKKFSKKLGKSIASISPAMMRSLEQHNWPGNIRELANVIERAVISAQGYVLQLTEDIQAESEQSVDSLSHEKTLEEMEHDYIIQILDQTEWKIEGKNGAAYILDINPSTLRTRMAKLGIQRPRKVSG